MAKLTSVNVPTTTNGGCVAIFTLVSQLVAGGWTVQSSSDGTTYKSTPGSQIVSAGSGAGGFNNTNAWVRVQDPAGRREFIFQRKGSNQAWTISYSALSKFIGGSPDATTPPTAADGQDIYTNSTLYGASPGTYLSHIIVQTTPMNGVYGFWTFNTTVTTGVYVGVLICCEPLQTGSYDSSDPDPCIFTTSSSNPFSSSQATWKYWYKYGTSSAVFVQATTALLPYLNSNMVGDITAFPYETKDVLLPIGIARDVSAGSTVGWKGWAGYLRFKGPARAYPDTCNLSTDAYVYLVDYAIPWENGTTPSV